MDMYSKFESLLEKHNTTAYKVGKATNITSSTFSNWKNGISTPKVDKLQKIADYFGVPVGYFTGEEVNIAPSTPIEPEKLTTLPVIGEIRAGFPLTKSLKI